jgi:hypothetical protein
MMATTPLPRCRVKIVDDIRGRETIVESPRDRSQVFLDLVAIVRRVNRRQESRAFIAGSIHLLPDAIVLHWHCLQPFGSSIAAETLALAEPLHMIERVIWGGL